MFLIAFPLYIGVFASANDGIFVLTLLNLILVFFVGSILEGPNAVFKKVLESTIRF